MHVVNCQQSVKVFKSVIGPSLHVIQCIFSVGKTWRFDYYCARTVCLLVF